MTGATGELTLGWGAQAQFQLEALNVEPAHARVRWDENGVFLEDISQQHETFLNGQRFEGSSSLGDGDRIWLGKPGDHDSVRVLVSLPAHPREFAGPAEETADDAPVEESALPALDQDAALPAFDEEPAASAPVEEPAAPALDEKAAPAAPAEEKWGALDDNDELMASDAPPAAPPEPEPAPAAPPPPVIRAKASTGPIPVVAPHVAPHATPHAPRTPSPRAPSPLHRRVAAKPPVPRAILVGIGAALLGTLGFVWHSRSQAPAPVLLTLLPPKAEPGQTVQITGSGFETKPEDNAVSFGDKPAEITAASETQLSVTVPAGLSAEAKSQHGVRVKARGAKSNTLFFRVYVGPKVLSFDPDVAMPGDVVKATGEHFGDDTAITVGGSSAEMLEVQPNQLRFRVPRLSVPSGKALSVDVQVGGNSARATTLLIGKLPLILELVPTRGLAGERVVLKGRGFDAAPGGSRVWFGGRPALVLAASERELQVVVPGAGRLSGPSEVEVSVRARGATSAVPGSFQVARVSSAAFVPRFYPEPGADPDTVQVSSELGPLLILRGKGDAPSAAERGARAAAAINALIEQALRGSASIELREKPLGIAAAGATQLLVAALPEDGTAYPGAHPSARTLARYWAALLQDYVTLFAQKQRPIRVVELQPRGQALLELYAAAERRAGIGSGVPPVMLESLAPSQLRALAELALNVPAESQAASGAAVAGRWDGTLEETGQAPRAIQVRLRAASGGLAGTLTASAGKISGELPLQNASYAGGTLRFVVKMGATPLHFDGKVDGRTVSGEVSADAKPRGRFSLRWVE
jgi:hypothetical protein